MRPAEFMLRRLRVIPSRNVCHTLCYLHYNSSLHLIQAFLVLALLVLFLLCLCLWHGASLYSTFSFEVFAGNRAEPCGLSSRQPIDRVARKGTFDDARSRASLFLDAYCARQLR